MKLEGTERVRLLEELHKRYSRPANFRQRLQYLRKKYFWIFFIEGAKLLKRVLDVTLSITLMFVLTPLFLLIAFVIKLQDGGPVFYVTNRVGKWGREFRFPKFRTMVPDAERQQEELAEFNEYPSDVKFKMKGDPRVTPFGRFLRKTSLDELPQLWCVLLGEMSLVGPRPPLPEEVSNYSLRQRRRLDISPGLTCIWQVSGRSEIPFREQVQLDVQYIESQSFWLDLKLLAKTIPAVILGRGAY